MIAEMAMTAAARDVLREKDAEIARLTAEKAGLLAELARIAAIKETAPYPWNTLNDGPIIARNVIVKVEGK